MKHHITPSTSLPFCLPNKPLGSMSFARWINLGVITLSLSNHIPSLRAAVSAPASPPKMTPLVVAGEARCAIVSPQEDPMAKRTAAKLAEYLRVQTGAEPLVLTEAGLAGATLLGFQPHDIPVLIAAKLLQPLGKPVANSPKYLAACVIEELRSNPDWLDRATRAVTRHWQFKNSRKSVARLTEVHDQTWAIASRN
jgi:hypothetical protein